MLDPGSYIRTWLCWFEQKIRCLEQRQSELEEENKRLLQQVESGNASLTKQEEDIKKLHEKIDNLKPVPGNITYKIQELHVNELKGTLNIGLTSLVDQNQLAKMIEQLKQGQDAQMENLEFLQKTREQDEEMGEDETQHD